MSAALRAVRVTLAVSCVVLAACRATPDAPSDAFVSTGEEALRVLTRSYSDVPVRIVGLPRGLEDAALAAIRELLQQYAEPEREEAYLDDAAFELQLLLRERGYPAATVEYAVTGLLGEERAELLVSAGPEVTVEGVRLEGAQGLPITEADVRDLLGEPPPGVFGGRPPWPYDADRVQRAGGRISDLLVAEGYLDASARIVVPPFEEAAQPLTLTVVVESGALHRLADIELELAPAPPTTEDAPEAHLPQLEAPEGEAADGSDVETADNPDDRALREACRRLLEEVEGPRGARPRPFSQDIVRVVYGGLVTVLERAGYPDADVEVTAQHDAATARVTLHARVVPGQLVRLGAVSFAGAESTRESFLESRVELRPGDRFDGERLRRDVRSLYRTGLFREVRSELTGTGHERNLVFHVVERPTREVWVEPGYGSYELLRLGVGVRELSLFGSGRSLRGEATAAIRAQRVSATLTDPWLLGHDLVGDLRVEYDRREEPSFVRLQRGAGLFVTKQWRPRESTSFGYQFRRSEVQDVTVVEAELEDDPEVIDLSTLRLSHRIDRRDDLFVPTGGAFVEGTLEYGSDVLGSELDFLRTTVNYAVYRALGRRDVLAFGLRAGVIMPVANDDSIPLQERFFGGGENSVRSFLEGELGPKDRSGEPIGGESFTTVGLEWRHMLTPRLQGAAFVDAGKVGLQADELFEFEDIRSGLGVGVRYLLPIGPLRLDVAVNPDPRSNEDDWAAHFSIGMAF
jgi:outer membrane protein insertion porin family